MTQRILFMEDEDTIREVLSEYLKIAGYQVTQAADGQVAWQFIQDQEFDLIILDIMVPHISGLEILQRLQEQANDCPVIMLTALGDEKIQVEAFNHYADDFIIKPVSPLILLKRVETVLRRAANRKKPVEPASSTQATDRPDLVLDDLAYKATYQGRDLDLTLSEFLLLQLMHAHPGQVFTRDQLINHVFGQDYICTDRIIDTHIKNLRKKLPIACIKTVIGLGYRYEVTYETK
ncbi:response regulator transcription factor [Vaginisenegalia massiliensis]|uniref:response regulator transcription factor n=1 Tax=Vaginisenegalia massiliensis TaxID=2058294 RepID=UPI000F53FF30|nr:response regulator transcription factor [Vaginisenegalia massiliensis]